jgi:hypothetical protein
MGLQATFRSVRAVVVAISGHSAPSYDATHMSLFLHDVMTAIGYFCRYTQPAQSDQPAVELVGADAAKKLFDQLRKKHVNHRKLTEISALAPFVWLLPTDVESEVQTVISQAM